MLIRAIICSFPCFFILIPLSCTRKSASARSDAGHAPHAGAVAPAKPVVVDPTRLIANINSASSSVALKAIGTVASGALKDPADVMRARISLLRAVRNRRRPTPVRIAAIEAIAALNDRASVPVLVDQLEHETTPAVKRALENALQVLSTVPGPNAPVEKPTRRGTEKIK